MASKKKVQFAQVLEVDIPTPSVADRWSGKEGEHMLEALRRLLSSKTWIPGSDDNVSDSHSEDQDCSSSQEDESDDEEVNNETSFSESPHGEDRRRQRQISKVDLETAKKYGTKQHGLNGRVIYRYDGLTFVYDSQTGKEVTSWTRPDALHTVKIAASTRLAHDEALAATASDHSKWRSNTVVVVDTSGSMRQSDVVGARNRLKAVWVSLAVDYIAHRLETGEANEYDLVSVVLLGERLRVLWNKRPWSWILYNDIVRTYRDNCVLPSGHGPFLPSLKCTEGILGETPGNCALALAFFSDGEPSDHLCNGGYPNDEWGDIIAEKIGRICSNFGKRLTFKAVAIGKNQSFTVLRKMVSSAEDNGAVADLVLPTMSVAGIGGALTSLATSLTTTQLALTENGSLAQRLVREVQRESKSAAMVPIAKINPSNFHVFDASGVRRQRYQEYFQNRRIHSRTIAEPLQHPGARYVAMCKKPFGEGIERFAFRFYEIATDGVTIVGRPMVAKDSRYVVKHERDWKARLRYVRKFCRTQQKARLHAIRFNKTVAKIPCVHEDTPRIYFLDCSVYHLNFDDTDSKCVLVEDMMLGHEWQKWNGNDGFVRSENKGTFSFNQNLRRRSLDVTPDGGGGNGEKILFNTDEVAQAFSHFTFCDSGRKRLVCDLQGVWIKDEKTIRLSDPVIHYHRCGREARPHRHGKTDHGRVGMQCFQTTHKCNELCQLVIRGFKSVDWHDTEDEAFFEYEQQKRRKRRRLM